MACILSVLRRKSVVFIQVGLLAGREAKHSAKPFHLPRQTVEWYYETVNPRSQWRDRAGFAPDFPFTPLRAPEHLNATTRKHEGQAREAGKARRWAFLRDGKPHL